MKKAIIFGATGFIGSHLLSRLLEDDTYELVTIVVRKDPGIVHHKLRVLIGDFNSLPPLRENITADDVFITLGTTKEQTPDKKKYYQVDHDYPVLAATIAKENGANAIFLVTAVGANTNSSIFYIRTKGETERDIIALDFEHTHIFRPGMIMGNRNEHRPMEKMLIRLFSIINPVFRGKFSKYRGIKGEHIALAIKNAAKKQTGKHAIYHWQEMTELL